MMYSSAMSLYLKNIRFSNFINKLKLLLKLLLIVNYLFVNNNTYFHLSRKLKILILIFKQMFVNLTNI